MTTSRQSYPWSPSGVASPTAERFDPADELPIRLAVQVDDRASSAASLVLEASEIVAEWLAERDDLDDVGPGAWEAARVTLDEELGELENNHGWRAPVAHWLAALRGTLQLGSPTASSGAGAAASPRELLLEELGLWLGGEQDDPRGAWSGRPLAAGRRLPDRASCVLSLVDQVERGEVIVVHGWSESVALALEEVHGRGRDPEVVVSEGGPDLGGRRMALRLAPAGIRLRLVYDAALFDALTRADRVWLGTEAIGAEALVGRVGTRALLERAREREVESAVLATTDKLMPAGKLALPAWCEHASWLLWERAPEGVRVESQAYERVPLDLPHLFATELGRLTAAELSLRSLRTGA